MQIVTVRQLTTGYMKSVRDRLEGIPVTGIYFGLCWLSLGLSLIDERVGVQDLPSDGL